MKIILTFTLILVFVLSTGILSLSADDAVTTGSLAENNQNILLPEQALKISTELCYGISKQNGFLVSNDAGKTWVEKNKGLPTKSVYPTNQPILRPLTGFGVDPVNPARVAIITSRLLFLSENSGENWEPIPLKGLSATNLYLTAVALSPFDKNIIALGTSFAGIFETHDRGMSWRNISENLRFLYQGAGFWEEIDALAYHPGKPGNLLFAGGFGSGLYLLPKERQKALPIEVTPLIETAVLKDGQPEKNAVNGEINAINGEINAINYDNIYHNLYFTNRSISNDNSPNNAAGIWQVELASVNGIKLGHFNGNQITLESNLADLQLKNF